MKRFLMHDFIKFFLYKYVHHIGTDAWVGSQLVNSSYFHTCDFLSSSVTPLVLPNPSWIFSVSPQDFLSPSVTSLISSVPSCTFSASFLNHSHKLASLVENPSSLYRVKSRFYTDFSSKFVPKTTVLLKRPGGRP